MKKKLQDNADLIALAFFLISMILFFIYIKVTK